MAEKTMFKSPEEGFDKFKILLLAFILFLAAFLIATAIFRWCSIGKQASYALGVSDVSKTIIKVANQCRRVDITSGNQSALLIDVRCLKLPENST